MAKQAQALPAVKPLITITSLKDGAYQQAKASDLASAVARYVIDQVKGFPETVPDEVKDQLFEGYRLRFNENQPAKQYAVVDGNYLLIDGSNPDLANAREKITLSVDYVFSYSQQQFGRLKNENPKLHGLVGELRGKVSTYCSNRLGDLKRQAKAIKNEGVTRERGATADFAKRITDTFSDLADKCKKAKARGDETANEAKFKEAKIAFMVKWNA